MVVNFFPAFFFNRRKPEKTGAPSLAPGENEGMTIAGEIPSIFEYPKNPRLDPPMEG